MDLDLVEFLLVHASFWVRKAMQELVAELTRPGRSPTARSRPRGRAQAGVVPARGQQQPGRALLDELLAVDSDAAGEATGEAGDRRQEGFDQPPARIRVAGLGRDHELSLLSPGDLLGVAHRADAC